MNRKESYYEEVFFGGKKYGRLKRFKDVFGMFMICLLHVVHVLNT